MDMQEITAGAAHAEFFSYDSGLLQRVNAVISQTDADAVIYIRNLMKRNLLSRFAPVQVFDGTPGGELAENLLKVSKNVFRKYSGDAFKAAEFAAFMEEQQFDTVELIGVDGGGCVALTAMGAQKRGLHVILRTDAIGTMFTKQRDKYNEKLKQGGAEIL